MSTAVCQPAQSMEDHFIPYSSDLNDPTSYSQADALCDFYGGEEDPPNLFYTQSSSSDNSPISNDNFHPFDNLESGPMFEKPGSKAFLDDNAPWYSENDILFAPTDTYNDSHIDFSQQSWQTTMEQGSTTMENFHEYLEDSSPQSGEQAVVDEPTSASSSWEDKVPAHPNSATPQSFDSDTKANTPAFIESEPPTSEPESTTSRKPQRTRRKKSTRQQEEAALDKQRERNRLAAGRCRKKQIERSQRLTDKADALEKTGAELHCTVAMLNAQVLSLKEELLRHNDCGCAQIRDYLQWRVEKLLEHPRGQTTNSTGATMDLEMDQTAPQTLKT